MKRTAVFLLILILAKTDLLAQETGTRPLSNPGDYKSDSHFHLLDFLQNGEFLNTDGKFPGTEWGLAESGRYSTLPFGERGRRIEALLREWKRRESSTSWCQVCRSSRSGRRMNRS